ncbi:hypothetical protein IPV08_15080 [Methylobacterium sp. SD274]|uniref:hypothetical protein n=1 Tax=Methylobacterium sp. SD274 TaxID=2782009 RepID=UPI001A97B931|nr:hypothetical protein [Methylobacterium sp. SD274]MBO1021289.1 hypothetical protein [Methylobacterium sp. SD274]
MTWIADSGAYRQAYINAVTQANDGSVLDPQFVADLSLPQAVAVHESYFASEIRLLVMGQETKGKEADPDRFGYNGVTPEHAWADATGPGIAAAYQSAGPFWQAFNLFCGRFGRADTCSVAWSNVSKAQVLAPHNGSVAVHNHPNFNAQQYGDWQAELFRAEIEFLKPHAVLAFVGPNEHGELLHTMLNHGAPVGAHAAWRDKDGYRIWSRPGLKYCLVSAYHPNGYAARVPPAESAENATYALMRLLKQQGPSVPLPPHSWPQRLRAETQSHLACPAADIVGTRLKHADGRFGTIMKKVDGWPWPIVVEDRYSYACNPYESVEDLVVKGWVIDE